MDIRKFLGLFFAAMTVFVLLSSPVLACTTFCLKNNKGEVLFGKNYDWMVPDGIVYINRRGVSKISGESDNPAQWVSRYGSVTFNQYGWESPSGGMNEAGLVIELMWLDGTKYPSPEGKPIVDVLEWIQYNLDTAATTADVIAASEKVRIYSQTPLHYLVNDRAGNSATIEFLDGKLVAHTGDTLPVATLTNDTYKRSLRFAETADPAATRTPDSLHRFTRAAARTRNYKEKELDERSSVAYAFDTLADAAQPNYTQWSIVYDQQRSKVHFRTLRKAGIKTVDLKAFDLSCSAPVMALDIDSPETGDVTKKFVRHTREMNRSLLERSFNGTDFLRSIPAVRRDELAAFPERFTCSGVRPAAVEKAVVRESGLGLLGAAFPLYYVYKQFIA